MSFAPVEVATDYDASVTVRSLLRSCGIQGFLDQAGVTEVSVNRPGEVWTESPEGWQRHVVEQCTLDRLHKLVHALAIFNKAQPRLSSQDPCKPVRLPDGQRGQVVIPPACEPGTISLTIRIPSARRYTLEELVASGQLSGYQHVLADGRELSAGVPFPADATAGLRSGQRRLMDALHKRDILGFLSGAVAGELNIALVGGTGSGKTTLMKALADRVSPQLRVATIEDTHELSVPCLPNHVHLFYSDALPATEIVKSTLRMKFDRVFLAEVRGNETWDYLTLLNTGHAGGMTSVHANDALEGLGRIATLVKQSPVGQTMEWGHVIREVRTTIDVVLFMKRYALMQVLYDPASKARLLKKEAA